MRFFGIFVSVLFLLAAASAADIKIKVVDPQSAAVAGAQVELFRCRHSTPAPSRPLRPMGWPYFAELELHRTALAYWPPALRTEQRNFLHPVRSHYGKTSTGSGHGNSHCKRHPHPGPSSVAGADVESLNAGQLEVMRPVAADDALHFLPGAVVSHSRAARRALLVVRARRRFHLQQSHCRRCAGQRSGWNL